MSMESYRRNVRRGVTGRYTETCFSAVCEMLSPGELKPETHKAYEHFVNWYSLLPRQGLREAPAFAVMLDLIFTDLGYTSWRDIEYRKASTQFVLKEVVDNFVRRDHAVILDIDWDNEVHSVGLRPQKEGVFTLVSTGLPRDLQGEVSYDDLYNHRHLTKDPCLMRYPFNDANITALPPLK
jgi:hypothetical protein